MIPGMGHDGHDIWHHFAVVRGWWSAISHHLDHHIWHTFLWKIPFASLSANKKQSWQQTCRHLIMKSHLFAAAMPKKKAQICCFTPRSTEVWPLPGISWSEYEPFRNIAGVSKCRISSCFFVSSPNKIGDSSSWTFNLSIRILQMFQISHSPNLNTYIHTKNQQNKANFHMFLFQTNMVLTFQTSPSFRRSITSPERPSRWDHESHLRDLPAGWVSRWKGRRKPTPKVVEPKGLNMSRWKLSDPYDLNLGVLFCTTNL